MRRIVRKKMQKILAILLALAMAIGMVPESSMAASEEHPDSFTVTVKEGDVALEGITVSYEIKVNDATEITGSSSTDAKGVAVISEMESYSEKIESEVDEVKISCSITKDGYQQAAKEEVVTAVDGNIDMILIKTAPETVTVTVKSQGSGLIKLNGTEQKEITVEKGSDVTVEFTPVNQGLAKTYIKQLVIGDNAVEVTKYETYSGTVKPDASMEINIEFVTEYTVTASAGTGGRITLNGSERQEITVDENSKVDVLVEANEGYQVESVSINGEDQSVSKTDTFKKQITISQNTEVSAAFVKVYTITVEYDSQQGTVKTSPDNEKGKVKVKKGDKLTITAQPNENYRVSKVTKNGDVLEYSENNKKYEDTVKEVDKDYTYEIIFAPNHYMVTVTTNGTAESGGITHQGGSGNGSFRADINTRPEINIQQQEGYHVSSVKINGTEHIDSLTETGENTFSLALPSVTNDMAVQIDFTENEQVEAGEDPLTGEGYKVTFLDEKNQPVKAVREYTNEENNQKVFVLSKDTRIEIVPQNEYTHVRMDGNSESSEKLILTETTDIRKITVGKGTKGYVSPKYIIMNIRFVIDKEPDTITLEPEEGEKPNGNGYYNNDVSIAIKVEGSEEYSGIAKVEYCILDGQSPSDETGYEVLYNKESGAETLFSYERTIIVTSEDHNGGDIRVYVRTTDLAGNVYTTTDDEACRLKICTTTPEVFVEFDDTDTVNKEENGRGYFGNIRTAHITITDNADAFSEAVVLNPENEQAAYGLSIQVSAVDAKGSPIQLSKAIGNLQWEHSGKNHTATITFSEDGNYTWSLSYKNLADFICHESCEDGSCKNNHVSYSGTTPKTFTVDTEAPLTAEDSEDSSWIGYEETVWTNLADALTFGGFSPNEVKVTAEGKDAISPIESILYYKSDAQQAITRDELGELYSKGQFTETPYIVNKEEQFVIYARITDYAGKTVYIGTDGIIIDMTEGEVKLTPRTQPNEYKFYNDDVKIDVHVDDLQGDSTAYSGIKTIDYTIAMQDDMENILEEGNLYSFKNESPVKSELLREWESNKEDEKTYITVDAEKYNAPAVVVSVTAEDNAGNKATETQVLNICKDIPEVEVEFKDEANRKENGRGYFGAERVACVTVKDRADVFEGIIAVNPDNAQAVYGLSVNVSNDKGTPVNLDVTNVSWKGSGNIYKAEIHFPGDENYVWSLSYTNRADLTCHETCDEKDCGKSHVAYVGDTPKTFTVDLTQPTGSVTIGTTTWIDVIENVAEALTFGLFSKTEVMVTATAEDATSPVTVEYYKTDNPVSLTVRELEEQTFTTYEEFAVSSDEQLVVYLKVTDYAGNYVYISSEGYIVDMTPSDIVLTPDPANESGFYNRDVNVAIDVTDAEPYSGIKKIWYEVKNQNSVTQKDDLYIFENENPKQRDLLSEWHESIFVNAKENNSCDVTVTVYVEDNAGNISEKSTKLDIDITKPTIKVFYNNNQDNNGNGYFSASRTATVEITERAHHFDEKAATKGIKITAVDAKGNNVPLDWNSMFSGWTTLPLTGNASPDEAVHRATITYSRDANYEVSIAYTDKAGNKASSANASDSRAPWKFTVDKTAPIGTVKAKTAEGRSEIWDELADSLTFGFWSGKQIVVTRTAEDATSPIASVVYYKTDRASVLTVEKLREITDWKNFSKITINPNEQFVIYVKITDMAGNVSYISSDGMIADNKKPRVESIAPQITIRPEQPVNGIYRKNVGVDIDVQETEAGGTYSGLKTIRYKVFNMGKETQSGVLYSFDKANPKRNELRKKWSGKITVNSKLNNSNQVVIRVYAEDNAKNTSKAKEKIKIDITAPKIDISYNNNSPDSEKYYKQDRVATVTVTERNFDADEVLTTIRNSEGGAPAISAWREIPGTGNLDNTKHTATITYHDNGDYTFDITCTDLGGLTCPSANYASGTANPTEFTMDQTAPVVTVSYDNNAAQNGKYFKENRTGTVTITEHNFDESRVKFTQTASLDGSSITIPGASWSSSGDIHTATFSYESDGDYTFDVTMTDLAGNESAGASYGDSVAGQEFTVDTSIKKPVIGGVENGKSYKEEVIASINFEDVNFADDEIHLLRTRKDEKNVDVTEKFIKELTRSGRGGSGVNDTFAKIAENDGIYTLTVKISDLAGNEETSKITFTVNRFGSVYVFSDYLISLKNAYTQSVEKKLVVTEYNPDRLLEGSLDIQISRDGTPLDKVDYKVSPAMNDKVEVGESGWYQYEYEIDMTNFQEDGIYRLVVASEDVAGNKPETTNYDDGDILFHVDTTPAEIINVTGLENAIVNAESQEVDFDIFDAIGLKKITVYIDDEPQETYSTFEDLVNFSGSVVVSEGMDQKVRLLIEDLAGNITDTDQKTEEGQYLFQPAFPFSHQLTVSTNMFVRWYANKLLFWGTVGTVAALAGILFLILLLKKRREEEL